MKKLPKYLSNIGFAMWIWGVFLVPNAFAQSSFLLSGQGVLSTSGSALVGSSANQGQWIYRIGTNLSGDSTGAFVAVDMTTLRTNGQWLFVTLVGYTNSSYSTATTSCMYSTQDLAIDIYTASEPTFLTHYSGADTGVSPCSLKPDLYYEIQVLMQNAYGGVTGDYIDSSGLTFYGSSATTTNLYSNSFNNASTTVISAYYALVGDNFQITPDSADSGILLSGAVSYCNGVLASTTGIGASIANGFCIALGFLFVPTPDSLQQFSAFADVLKQKIPFSYAYGVYDSFNGLTASSTENLESFSITGLGNFASSSPYSTVIPSSIDIISTTTISKYYPDPVRNSMLFLASCAIWFVLILAIYHRIIPHKVKI